MKSHEGLRQKYEKFSEQNPYIASMGETALLYGMRYGLEKAGDKIGLKLGHGRKNSRHRNYLTENHPVVASGAAVVWAPVTEELVFRELPARILDKKGYESDSDTARKAKLAAAGVFAAIHAGPDGIPLPQFIGGLNYARIHNKRGLKASIVAHATNNALGVVRHFAKNKQNR